MIYLIVLKRKYLVASDFRWLAVNPKELDKLRFLDPYGFYMYCVNRIARMHNENYNPQKGSWRTTEAHAEHNVNMIKGYQIVQHVSKEDILIAGDRFAKLFSYCSPRADYGLHANPINYTSTGFIKSVGLIVHNLLADVIEKHGREKDHATARQKEGRS